MKSPFFLFGLLIAVSLACSLPLIGEQPDEETPLQAPAATPVPFTPRPIVPPAQDKWDLWVDGPRLRGVDLHPCRVYAPPGCAEPISRQDVSDLRKLGANLINASYPGVFTEGPPYEVNPTALAYLDDLIDWAGEEGMYVVVHFRTGPGRNENAIVLDGKPDYGVWQDQTAHDAWVEMWRFTAERFRDNPVVAGYDLMVEPHPNTLFDPQGNLSPTEFATQVAGTLLDWNALAKEITVAIRAIDPVTPIIVSSVGWASAAWFPALQPTGDPRTVYSVHPYDPDVYVFQEAGEDAIQYPDVVHDSGETITFDRAWLEENYAPVRDFSQRYGVPIYVGEFGIMRWVPGAVDYLRDQTVLFETFGWNYAVYAWRGDEPDFDGFDLEYGPDPDNHTLFLGNPLLDVFQNRWTSNVDFSGQAISAGETPLPGGTGTEAIEGNAPLGRDFVFTLPLFAPDSAWNQTANEAAVLPESDRQILMTFRVLLGDTHSLVGYDEAGTTWPYIDVGVDEYTFPIFRAGSDESSVTLCNYYGELEWPHPNFEINQPGGPVIVPAPVGTVRPSGPEGVDSDGHLVLYSPETFQEFDFWQATTVRNGECDSLGGGQPGEAILESGVVDFFDVRGPGASPVTYFSARAHGTPLLGGLIIPEDIEHGEIAHALAFAIPGPRNTGSDPSEPLSSDYFYPASTTETDYYNTDPFALAAGQRIRLKQTIVDEDGVPIDENELAPITRLFLAALRNYGAYLVDNATGFSFYAEDFHTANLRLTADQVNALIGQPPGTPLPEGMTNWQIVMERLGNDLDRLPFAEGPWEEGQNPASAAIEAANFEVVAPAVIP